MNLQEQIRKILREDFEWTEGPINPWIEYDGIVFDIEPTREDVNMYIEQCLNTRKVSNASQWTEDIREKDIDFIIQNSYLGLYRVYKSEINLGYLDDPYYKNGNVILYSKLIGQNISEGMEGLEWINNINTDKVGIRDLNIGDVVIIKCPRHKLIDKDEELTVSEIEDSYRTGEICVRLKNMKNMKYPFGKDREGVTNSVYVCEHISCDFYRLSY
jgi:hypothetical protein